jgi:preprotein translocase SecF subunit
MFFRRLNWNVVGWFNIVSWISYAVIALGIASMVFHYVQTGSALRLGLSFTGGTDITVHFTGSVTQDQLKTALGTVHITDEQLTTLSVPGDVGTPRWTIQTQTDVGNDSTPVWTALNAAAPGVKVDRAASQISTVGASLSQEYLLNAIKALVIAIAIQFLYIAFRFGWNYIFGLVTVIALVRDSAMMIGIYSIAGRRVDDAFLAAVLTVIGYSVMDTIVILDRIRENGKLMAGEPYDKIVNTSILQTMTRSVNTLATVVITLVALFALGGASLQNFAFALLVGICSGGYHSIFYSAPLVARLQKRSRERSRAAALDTSVPKTVAEARARVAGSADRAAIAAARKARKERERQASSRPGGGPVRYKRRRTGGPSAANGAIGTVEPALDENDDAYEYLEPIDPLDAQQAGLHDEAYELGHEAISLNLGDEETVDEHAAAEHPPHGTETHDH